jgi:hypothetical protein
LAGAVARLLAAAIAVAATTMAAAPAALATNSPSGASTIVFNEGYVNPGDYIGTAYLISAGVTFGTPGTLGFPGSVPAGIGECDPYLISGVSFGGSSDAAGETSCGSGEFPPPAGFMFHLEYARTGAMSFWLRALNGALGQSETGAQAIAYDHFGNAVQEVDLSAGQAAVGQQITFGPGAAIQYVEVNGLGTGAGIELTDLTLPAYGSDATPYWKLTDPGALPVQFDSGQIDVSAYENETLTIPLQILRENGSTGAINVTASDGGSPVLSSLTVDESPAGAPADVVDLQLTPAAGYSGSNVLVTMSGSAPGTAGAYDGAPLVFNVAIRPEFTLTASADAVGANCLSSIGLILTSLGSYAGPVTVTGTDTTGTHHFTQVVTVTGPGQYHLNDSTSAGVKLTYTATKSLRTTVAGLTYQTPLATPVLDESLAQVLSQSATEGGTFKFSASGLPCHELVVRTSPTDGSDVAAPPIANSSGFTPTSTIVPQNYVVTLNDYATSGPAELYDLNTDQKVFDLGELSVSSFRDTNAFSWVNNDYGMRLDDSMEDDLFGADQTNIDVLGWQVRKPEAAMYEQITNNHIPGGICFGIAYSELEFYEFPSERQLFAPNPALPYPWDFGFRSAPSAGLLRYVTERFSLQFTDQLIPVALNASIGIHGTDDDINEIKAQLAGGPIPVGMANWNGISLTGHTVLAYATKDLPDGSTAVLVANSNVPYLSSEESNYSSHVDRESTDSEIIIKNGNWTFPELGWSGSEADLVVYDRSELPIINGQRPALPSVFTSAPVLVFGSGGDGVTQLSGAHGTELFKGGQLAPQADWPHGVAPIPVFTSHRSPLQIVAVSPKDSASTVTASVARGAGGGGMAVYLPGLEGQLTVGSRAGTTDHVGVTPATGTLTYTSSARHPSLSGVLLTRPAAGAARSANPDQLVKFSLEGAGAGAETLSDRHGVVTVGASGAPATLTLALSGFSNQGVPVEVSLAPVRLSAGETLAASPKWSALTGSRVALTTTVNGRRRRMLVAAHPVGRAFARVTGASLRLPRSGAAVLDLRLAVSHPAATETLSIAATISGGGVRAATTPTRVVANRSLRGLAVVPLDERLKPGRYTVNVRVLEVSSDGALQGAVVVKRRFTVRATAGT